MKERIQNAKWDIYKDVNLRRNYKSGALRKMLSFLYRIGEYRNYVLLDENKVLKPS